MPPLSRPSRFAQIQIVAATAAFCLLGAGAPRGLLAQSSSSSPSASSTSSSNPQEIDIAPTPRVSQAEAAGSGITLDTSEPLFYIATALNACGYNNGLAESSPVRAKVRDEINDELAGSAPARDARDALCTFIREHALNDRARDLAQYVSLSLYLSPPPLLTPTVDLTELPPDSTQVVEVLPLLRTFAETVHLNALWQEHHAEYEGFIDRIHDPLTKMVLDTDLYLHLPVSSYDGRRFLVLLEPMLAPSETNARIYGNDYIVVVSPAAVPAASVPMDLIRHTYLHYLVEPMIYSRPAAMDRLQPLLKPVQDAPLEFSYKSDIASLLTECLIKAIEVHLMDVGIAQPAKPSAHSERTEIEHYEELMQVYDRQAETVRRKAVDVDMRQGWVLVEYFYDQLGAMEKSGIGLKDNIGPMVYGMDVDRERHHDEQIAFLPTGSGADPAFRDLPRHVARQPTGLDLAELKLSKGDVAGAGAMADAALKANPENAEAHYLLGRVDLMEGDPDEALDHLNQTIQLSHDPRTIAWAHIYLGRMYDITRDPDNPDAVRPQRDKAIAEYKAALAHRDSQPDTKTAAEKGIKEPFALPKSATSTPAAAPSAEQSGDPALDPTGKAEKESYTPTPAQ